MKSKRNYKLNIINLTLLSVFLFSSCSDDKKELEPKLVIATVSGTVAFNRIIARAFVFTAVIGIGISTDFNVKMRLSK